MTDSKLIEAVYGLPEYEGGNGADQVCRTNVIDLIRQHDATGMNDEARGEFFRIISLLQDRLQKTTNHLRRNGLSERLVRAGDQVRAESIERLEALLGKLADHATKGSDV